jgi:hypothetical protein
MKIASKPRNIVYIPQLTDETTVKYKVNEYIALYSSPHPSHVSRNIGTCVPRLTEEYIGFFI